MLAIAAVLCALAASSASASERIAPLASSAPTVSGTPAVAQTLTCTPGSWSDAASYSYTWLRDGSPIAGQTAGTYVVQDADQGHHLSCEVTAASGAGQYTIAGLATHSYAVEFVPYGVSSTLGRFAFTYYPGKEQLSEATLVSAAQPATTAGINAALGAAGSISGQVTKVGGGAVAGAQVCASEAEACATTNASGEYEISIERPGSYRVEVEPAASSGYAATWYPGGDYKESKQVSVSPGQAVTAIDAAVVAGGKITGKVTAGGPAVSGIEVCSYPVGETPGPSQCTSTEAAGDYVLQGLASGEYQVRFGAAEAGEYVTQWDEGADKQASAPELVVAAPNPHVNVNASLVKGGSITGTVTAAAGGAPLANVTECADEIGGAEAYGCSTSGSTGTYAITGLPTGSYTVRFLGSFEFTFEATQTPPGLLEQYYPGKELFTEATPVSVTTGATSPNINAAMADGAQISGRVTAVTGGAGIGSIEVCAHEAEAFFLYASACSTTNSNGEYDITGLPAGKYVLLGSAQEFEGGEHPDYVSEYFGGKPKESEATVITVAAKATVSAVDFSLPTGAEIAGTVTSASGTPLPGVLVCSIEPKDEEFEHCTETDEGGVTATAASASTAAVPLPIDAFSFSKAARFEPKSDQLEFFLSTGNAGRVSWSLYFKNADVGFADALGLGLAETGQPAAAARSARCKKGLVRHRGRCVHVLVAFAHGSAAEVGAGTLEVKVHADAEAVKALKSGHTLHVSGTITFQSSLGGAPVSHVVSVVVHPPKKHTARHR